ncbi:MAG: nitrite reductase small subunit NirD [Hyphomonadaceae bacterium]
MSVWIDIGAEADIPLRGARRFLLGETPIGVFRAGDGAFFALVDRCPHKNGPLSEGIVHGRAVTCPLHNWVISLETGAAQGADSGCTRTLPVSTRDGRVRVDVGALARAA